MRGRRFPSRRERRTEITELLTLEQAPQLALRPSAALVAFAELLALPAIDLDELVERELAENPALERVEPPVCGACGERHESPLCRPPRRRDSEVDRTDLLDALPQPETLTEALLAEVALAAGGDDRPVAEYVLGSLDEHGFLDTSPAELAAAIGVEPSRVVRVVDALRASGVAGLAAAGVRDCLLAQLDGLEPTAETALAKRIVAEHLEALAAGRFGAIARALGVGRGEVIAARDFLRERLSPYPALPATGPEAPRIVPDVVIRRRDDRAGFDVELVEPRRHSLGVHPLYERLLKGAAAALPPGEAAGVTAQVRRARSFLRRLDERWTTLRRVTEALVERQAAFLDRGRGLVPLTRAELAAELGLHESTVGRAVSGRYALLPSGRVVPLSRFFEASLGVREALAEIVAAEARPHSDGELAAALAERGFHVARRTVAKYRGRLGILPAALR